MSPDLGKHRLKVDSLLRAHPTTTCVLSARKEVERPPPLCVDEWQAEFFLRINNTGGPVDMWSVVDVRLQDLDEGPHGFCYLARPIPPDRLAIARRSIPPGWTSD